MNTGLISKPNAILIFTMFKRPYEVKQTGVLRGGRGWQSNAKCIVEYSSSENGSMRVFICSAQMCDED